MAKLGMDVDAIQALAGRLDGEAQRIQTVVGAVDAVVRRAGSDWHGDAAQRFTGDWYGRFRPLLQRVHHSITDLAASARSNAAEQDEASGAASGGASLPPPRIGGGRLLHHPAIDWTEQPGKYWMLRDCYAVPLAVIPGGMALLAGMQIHDVEQAVNQHVPGLGDVGGDAIGFIPEVGPGISIATDGGALIQDVGTGQFSGWDVVHVARDAVDLVPVVGEVDGAFKLGYDTGNMIANIPVVHHQMDTIEDGIVQYGAGQGGDIATRYDGIGGFGNFVTDFFGSIGL